MSLASRARPIYECDTKIGARYVEEAVQEMLSHLREGYSNLGSSRLWRFSFKGAKYDTPADVGKLHQVFATWSSKVGAMIADGTVKVQYTK